ncbi:MAG: hypothetical protein M1834_001702 [Cirrosporium novae-zelandiae]|nr:MAG: hypothetical protein M1834_001702 [Cirrosporium novae-zelandiae]
MASDNLGQETTATEIARIFSDRIRGKTILVTGVSPNSLGAETVRSIASQNPKLLIMASRTKEKLESVSIKIKEEFPDAEIQSVLLDLSSQKSVRRAADEINVLVDHLDILINNAGMASDSQERSLSSEGIEMHLATNHIGHFLLTNLLFEKLQAAAGRDASGSVRVINLSSNAYRYSPVRFADYNFNGKQIPPEEEPLPPAFNFVPRSPGSTYHSMVAYGQSKSANILFSVYLMEHLGKQGILSFCVHPGTIESGFLRGLTQESIENLKKMKGVFWKTPDQGAATTLMAALDPKLYKSSAIFMRDCQSSESAPYAEDKKLADKLWKLSEELAVENSFLVGRHGRRGATTGVRRLLSKIGLVTFPVGCHKYQVWFHSRALVIGHTSISVLLLEFTKESLRTL